MVHVQYQVLEGSSISHRETEQGTSVVRKKRKEKKRNSIMELHVYVNDSMSENGERSAGNWLFLVFETFLSHRLQSPTQMLGFVGFG